MVIPIPIVVLLGVLVFGCTVVTVFCITKLGVLVDTNRSLNKARQERDCNLASWSQATEERDEAREEAAANRVTESRLSDNSVMARDRDLARKETEQAKEQIQAEMATSKRAVVKMLAARKEKIDLAAQRDRAIADTEQATGELTETRLQLSELQGAIDRLATNGTPG